MKLIPILALCVACTTAHALPLNCKYTYQGKTYTGFIDSLTYSESNTAQASFTVANAHGFKLETAHPVDIKPDTFFLVTSGYQIYSFGATHTAPNIVLTYVQDIWNSYRYPVKHYGIGIDNGQRFLYFNLGDLQP